MNPPQRSSRYTPPAVKLNKPSGFEARQQALAQAIYGYCLTHDELVTDVHGTRTRWWIDDSGTLRNERTTKEPTGGLDQIKAKLEGRTVVQEVAVALSGLPEPEQCGGPAACPPEETVTLGFITVGEAGTYEVHAEVNDP